jgi:small GTP-binding protein
MDDDENLKVCKVVLLGETGVGKTCIIDRFINDNFVDNQKATGISTFIAKTMTFDEFQGKSVKYEIWDTAGQEQYRSLNKIFYKDAGVAILVYDITNENSFKEIQNYWVNQIKENAPKDISKKLYYFKFYFYFF